MLLISFNNKNNNKNRMNLLANLTSSDCSAKNVCFKNQAIFKIPFLLYQNWFHVFYVVGSYECSIVMLLWIIWTSIVIFVFFFIMKFWLVTSLDFFKYMLYVKIFWSFEWNSFFHLQWKTHLSPKTLCIAKPLTA